MSKEVVRLQEKLQHVYFDLIYSRLAYSDKEKLTIIINQIKFLSRASFVAIYLYDNWRKTYQLTAKSTTESKGLHKQLVPLEPVYGSPGRLMIGVNKEMNRLDDDKLQIFAAETEKVLSIMNQYNNKKDSEKDKNRLFDFSSRLFSVRNKKDVLTEIMNTVQDIYPEFTHYLLLSQDSDDSATLPVKMIEYSDDATKQLSNQAFLSGEVQRETLENESNASLYVPLTGNQAVYGVLQVVTPKVMEFPEWEIEFITQFANIAGKAIENAIFYHYSEHLVSDLKLINEVTHTLNSNLKLSDITKIVRNKIMSICHASQVGFIYYQDKENQTFEILSGSTAYFNTEQGQVLANYLLNKTGTEPLFNGQLTEEEAYSYRSVMAIPMSHSGAVHGMVIIMHEEPYHFTFETFKLMQSLIRHSTLALSNAILKERLEEAVITDYLTKLYSRDYLEEQIRKNMDKGEEGSIVLLDIDDFKYINDTYGHHIGDEVIKQVAGIIMRHVGSEDIPARWGGEELAIYMPRITRDEGFQLAGLIRSQVEMFTDPSVTISCGVSSWNKSIADSAIDLFIRVDKALYEAKNTGKNNVVKI
ncbi:diguanylate cyclase (GGDEF)-like protein [Virgibacillus natechei]|uniref:Diguanylate cyclase (GGDEF)-like protein n=1 Tax=Virgibacillus natechei TaxID=1216297 RepID=A0ABS4IDA2_9BACI|nr:diguanylate cyclase [Virgibacillus natechei]MBP1968911.1 diguanylate cyclase (GGDEF)-like protein [Virgibacillus natechei]UZD11703.1 diguanylate cyclase [Virgibacillus natechei]